MTAYYLTLIQDLIMTHLLRVCLLLVILSGCAQNQIQVEQTATLLMNNDIAGATAEIDKIKLQETSRDHVYNLMNVGIVKFIAGDYAASMQHLQAAKKTIAALQALSISENIQAATINETLRAYIGSPSEQLLIHFYLALNYLALNDFYGARVEILQANAKLQTLAEKDSLSGQLASVHMLSGMIFEMDNDTSNAMISYRKAAEIMQQRQQPLPYALKQSLLNMSAKLGLKKEYTAYKQQFSMQAKRANKNQSTLFVLYANGLVNPKQEAKVSVFSVDLSQQVSLALPFYAPVNMALMPQVLAVFNGQQMPLEKLENINLLAKEDLAREMPTLQATTLARAVIKFQATRLANEQSEGLGVLTAIASHVSEMADLRSWRLLPAQLLISRQIISNSNAQLSFNAQPAINISATGATFLLLVAQDYSNHIILFKK